MALSRSKEAEMRMIYCFYIKWHNGRDFKPISCDKCVLKIFSSANDSNQTIINFSRLKWFGTEIDTTCSLIFMVSLEWKSKSKIGIIYWFYIEGQFRPRRKNPIKIYIWRPFIKHSDAATGLSVCDTEFTVRILSHLKNVFWLHCRIVQKKHIDTMRRHRDFFHIKFRLTHQCNFWWKNL